MDATNKVEMAKRYIQNTIIPENVCDKYDMKSGLWRELKEIDPLDAILIAFRYGRAKGYRARKAEEKS